MPNVHDSLTSRKSSGCLTLKFSSQTLHHSTANLLRCFHYATFMMCKTHIVLRTRYSSLRWNQLWVFTFEGLLGCRFYSPNPVVLYFSHFVNSALTRMAAWKRWGQGVMLFSLQQSNSLQSSAVGAFATRNRHKLCPAQWTMFSLSLLNRDCRVWSCVSTACVTVSE